MTPRPGKRPIDKVYEAQTRSPTYWAIQKDVYGEEYSPSVNPCGPTALTELQAAATALRVGSRERILDVGCGQGGPGLWLARQTGASLVGIDLSHVALKRALETATGFNLANRAQFCMADLTVIPFKGGFFDGASSFAALFAVEDVSVAFTEIGRVLRSGSRLVFTSWSRSLAPPCYPPPVEDYRPSLERSGFEVEQHDPVPGAIDRIRSICEKHVAQAEQLEREMGEIIHKSILKSARYNLGLEDGIDYLAASQWLLVVARRT